MDNIRNFYKTFIEENLFVIKKDISLRQLFTNYEYSYSHLNIIFYDSVFYDCLLEYLKHVPCDRTRNREHIIEKQIE